MRRIDLHAHTNRSDGSLEPAALVRLAAESGLVALAVTDHDTTVGLDEAEATGRALGVTVIPGVEVTAKFPGRAMHVLGYGFDRGDARFQAVLAGIRRARDDRNPRILERLVACGVPVTMDDVLAQAADGATIGRPHIARAMVERGHAADVKTAFARWLRDGAPAFVAAESLEPAEAIAAVRAAGGVAVLAHPRQLRVGSAEGYGALFRDLARAGLAGVEVAHPSHSPEDRATFQRLAAEAGLVASGGSDFHGDAKPDIRLGVGDGTIEVTWETWESLAARRPA
jgi:predicted metal-dependent phosphoesterase TrpH